MNRRPSTGRPLHRISEQHPSGRWTSSGEFADAIGTGPQPLGNYVASYRHCGNDWRVRTSDGGIASVSRRSELDDIRCLIGDDPADLTGARGLTMSGSSDAQGPMGVASS